MLEKCKRARPIRVLLDCTSGSVAPIRAVDLADGNLLFDYAFVPELTEEARSEVWPNMNYGADVSPPGWNQAWSEGEVYERPPPEARHAWFDFFPPDCVWVSFDRRGQPGSDYLRNRIARLTFDHEDREGADREVSGRTFPDAPSLFPDTPSLGRRSRPVPGVLHGEQQGYRVAAT